MDYTIQTNQHTHIGKKVTPYAYAEVSLSRQDIFKLEGDHRQTRITCTEGIVWVSQPGDEQDYVLKAGQSVGISRRGLVLVSALPSGKIKVNPNR